MSAAAHKAFQDAVAAFRARKFADAERLCRTVLESRPQHVGALNLLTMTLMSVARFAEAATYVSRALSLDPRFDLSFRNFGIILGKLGKPKQALEQFDRALALNPTARSTWISRGQVLGDRGNTIAPCRISTRRFCWRLIIPMPSKAKERYSVSSSVMMKPSPPMTRLWRARLEAACGGGGVSSELEMLPAVARNLPSCRP
jgi:tetratricopeptide (TPR) repeat protein